MFFKRCQHEWGEACKEVMPSMVDVATQNKYRLKEYSGHRDYRRKLVIILTCKKCGKVKTIVETNP